MRYNLNLNRDEINCLGPKSDLNECGHVARHGPHIQLKLGWDKRGIREKITHFPGFDRERTREKEESQGFLPRSMKFRWSVFIGLRTKVHRIDEWYACIPGKRNFTEVPRGEISRNQFLGLGGFLPVYHTPKGKRFLLRWLTFYLWSWKIGFFV